jgi:GTPase SAR1 family protein
MLSDFLQLISGFVLFIGPSYAGKTSILRRLTTGKFEEHEPTFGFQEENIAKVKVIEIGGQVKLRKYWKTALDQNPAHIFFVIDATKESDYKEYCDFLNQYDKQYPLTVQKAILTVNKIDLVPNVLDHYKEGKSLITCSAKTGDGMLDILEAISSLKDNIESFQDPKLKFTSKKGQISIEKEQDKVRSILQEFNGKF